MKRGLLRIAATFAAATVLSVVLVPGTAHALQYDGQDPIATGCASSAYTAKSANIKNGGNYLIGRVELRYSTECQTAWARVVADFDNVGAAAVDRNTDGLELTCGSTLAWSQLLQAYSCYTKMVNDAGTITSFARGVIKHAGVYYYANTGSF